MDIFSTVGKYIMMVVRLIFSPRYVRIAAVMISIYQVILSHAILFSIVLGLFHAERVNQVLEEDIAEGKKLTEHTELPDNTETVNKIRFKSAQELSSITCLGMVAGTTMAAIYLLTCLALLIGTLKNHPKLMLPWLILDGISTLIMIIFMSTIDIDNYAQKMGGISNYMFTCLVVIAANTFIWVMIRLNYMFVTRANKLEDQLVETATVKLPFQAKKENVYLGTGGYKHLISDYLTEKPN